MGVDKTKQNAYSSIFDLWKKKWFDGDPVISGEYSLAFCDLVTQNYGLSENKKNSNKKKNFFMKYGYLALLTLVALGLIALVLVWIFNENLLCHGKYLLTCGGLLATAGVLLSLCVAKLIDVKSYQETWARHVTYHSHIINEMCCFLYGLRDYKGKTLPEQKFLFIDRFLAITMDNVHSFNTNLTTKEKPLYDFLDQMKLAK